MVTAVTTGTTTSTTTSTTKSLLSNSDFNLFLKMMTTQMKNQDPLNPMDSSDYATQLATFSGVEQQARTNSLLESLGAQMGLLGMSQLSAWVGQEARSSGAVWVDGDPVEIDVTTSAGADRAVLVVKDEDGATVSREEIDPAGGTFQWLGTDATGTALPEGAYTLSVESWRNGVQVASDAVEHYAPILEARKSGSATVLILEGGIEVASDAVTGLRVPQA